MFTWIITYSINGKMRCQKVKARDITDACEQSMYNQGFITGCVRGEPVDPKHDVALQPTHQQVMLQLQTGMAATH